MELYPAEVDSLKKIIEEWYLHDERELEATFSGKTASETTTFLNVAQRLEAKGFRALPQEDRLNIITPDQVRFTITGMGNIENYCREESLDGIEFEAMIKDRAGAESNVDIKEYNVRVKARREIKLAATDPIVTQILNRWPEQRKAFRILRRWTFMDDAGGVRYDLSMVRSSSKDPRGGFLWAKTFKERDITRTQANYELEVELLRPTETPSDPAEAAAEQAKCLKNLIRGVGEVLRGINKHSLLIRNSTALKVLEGYKDLVKTDRFRGVAPITMLVENMTKAIKPKIPNIRTSYNVTDKADGLRMMGYVDARGELFMIDMSLNIYRTGLVRPSVAHSLVDGEFVTSDKEGHPIQQFLLFDCYIAQDKQDITDRPFCSTPAGTEEQKRDRSRYGALMNWVDRWNEGNGPQIIRTAGVTDKNKIQVTAKQFIFATGDNIFAACARTLDSAKIYHTDGLILTPNAIGLPQKPGVKFAEQLKWKPSSENTVDFLALFDKDSDTRMDMVYSGTKGGMAGGETVQYKTLHLYVGSDLDPAYEDPRGTVLFEQPLPGQRQPGKGRRREYKPVLFNPVELPDTMANTCYLKVEEEGLEGDVVRCENGDPIEDKSIVEMRYDPKQEPGWRWIPMRIRYDKTERYQRGELGRTLNKDESAEGVWNSIHEPVTAYMIRTGMEAPSAVELADLGGAVEKLASGEIAKVYYARKEEKKDLMIVKGLREFHRRYIKEKILLGRGLRGGGKTLADLACGQGGDLWTWVDFNASFVFGTDIAGNGIRDPQDGAYRRYMNAIVKYNGYENVPRMIFTIGSSAKNLATGEAGATPEESNMMRSVLGRVAPDGPVPPFVQKFGAGRLAKGVDCVAIMFAIHYFFENELSLSGFMRNVNDTLAVGGLFIGCCFDGQKVFDSLRMTPKDGSRTGVADDSSEVWRITKRYDAMDLTNTKESLGLPIDVKFISIGTEQREFLVSFELLKAEMAKIGCELLNEKELKELDLTHSTQMFEDTFSAAKKKGEKFDMIPVVKEYSFFNRWFIFKRRRGVMMDDEEVQDIQESMNSVEPMRENVAERSAAEGAVKTLAEQAAEARTKALATAAAKKGATATAAPASAAAPLRTIPAASLDKKPYTLTQLFQFYTDASQADKLKLKDPDAARWLAPSAPFAIKEAKEADETEYPSVEHYLAAKKYELASNKPELGKELFSRAGTIHQEFLRQRATESAQGARALTSEREHELLKAERKKVLDESAPASFKKYRAIFDDTMWFTVKDKELEKALSYRWINDARLRRIVDAAKAKGLYLLYYTGVGSGSDLGGKRTDKGFIDGENKVGEILMRLAKY